MSKNTTLKVQVMVSEKDRFSVRVARQESEKSEIAEKNPLEIFNSKLEDLSQRWVTTAISFFEILPSLAHLGLIVADKELEAKSIPLLDEICIHKEQEEKDSGERSTTYTIDKNNAPRLAKTLADATRIAKTSLLMQRYALGTLISEYEALMADLVSAIVEFKPEILGDADYSFKLSDIDHAADISEFKSNLISRKVEDTLHSKTHKELLKFLNDRTDTNSFSDKKLIAEFVEICQRRHVLSHAGGRASNRYVRVCNEEGCPPEIIAPLGEIVNLDVQYLRRATSRVFQVGFFTTQLIWQKLSNCTEKSDYQILAASHTFLEYDLTKMAKRVSKFSLGRKSKKPTGILEVFLMINLAQSYKFCDSIPEDDREEKVESVIKEIRKNDVSPIVDLAICCLENNFDDIEEKLIRAAKYGNRQLKYHEAFTWNIFKEARKNEAFMNALPRAFPQEADRVLQIPPAIDQ